MPLQCDICESIRIVPMLLDVPTLRRNKFRDPRFMGSSYVYFQMGGFPFASVHPMISIVEHQADAYRVRQRSSQ